MDINELIAYTDRWLGKAPVCPFEEFKWDGLDYEVEEECEDNDSGKLARNLKKGLPGKEGTYNKNIVWSCFPEEKLYKKINVSFKNKSEIKLEIMNVDGKLGASNVIFSEEKGDGYEYKEAAHHLIPGGALFAEDCQLFQQLLKKGAVSIGGINYTRQGELGYNINGSHNGVWLPAPYAYYGKGWGMDSEKPLEGVYEKEAKEEWKTHYVVAAMLKRNRQFHDTHGDYTDKVKKVLDDEIHAKIRQHLRKCEKCKKREGVLPPPLGVIKALQNYSGILRQYLARPEKWDRNYVTSCHWAEVVTAKSAMDYIFLNKINND